MEVLTVTITAALLRLVWRNLTLPVRLLTTPVVAVWRSLGNLLTTPARLRHRWAMRAIPRGC